MCCIDASVILIYSDKPPFGVISVVKTKTVVFFVFSLAIFLSSRTLSQQDEIQRILIEKGNVDGDVATLSFRLMNPHSPELMEVMKSGIEVRFEYEVVVKRVHKNWFNVPVAKGSIVKSIHYDPLSNEYIVTQGYSSMRKFFKDLKMAAKDFFTFHDLEVRLSEVSVSGKKYEISVRAQLDDLDVVGVFKYIPFISNWFRLKTDWARIRVNAR